MIRVTIEIDHGDGSIEIKRDSEYLIGAQPIDALHRLVTQAHAETLAALNARTS